jgi:hypothetical protein
MTALTALLAQTGNPAADAQSLADQIQTGLFGISDSVILIVYVAGILGALLGQVLGIKILSTTIGKVVMLCLVAAFALRYGPAYLSAGGAQ